MPGELWEAWRRAVAALLGVPVDRVSVNEKYARSLLPRLVRVGSWLELADLLCRAAWLSLEQVGDDSMLDVRWPNSPEYRLPRRAASICADLLTLVQKLVPAGG